MYHIHPHSTGSCWEGYRGSMRFKRSMVPGLVTCASMTPFLSWGGESVETLNSLDARGCIDRGIESHKYQLLITCTFNVWISFSKVCRFNWLCQWPRLVLFRCWMCLKNWADAICTKAVDMNCAWSWSHLINEIFRIVWISAQTQTGTLTVQGQPWWCSACACVQPWKTRKRDSTWWNLVIPGTGSRWRPYVVILIRALDSWRTIQSSQITDHRHATYGNSMKQHGTAKLQESSRRKDVTKEFSRKSC